MGVIKGDTIPPTCRATGLDLHLDSDGVKVLIWGIGFPDVLVQHIRFR